MTNKSTKVTRIIRKMTTYGDNRSGWENVCRREKKKRNEIKVKIREG